MTKVGLRYLKSPAHSQSSFRPKENMAIFKLKLMLDENLENKQELICSGEISAAIPAFLFKLQCGRKGKVKKTRKVFNFA